MALRQQLKRLMEARESFSREEACFLMQHILTGSPADLQIAALLGALAARGETAAEIAGFADAMRGVALEDAERARLVDTCGTGGDASGTFNISTASALVAAAAGATVAKHGNRAVTSQCGSADVLEALGIPVDLSPTAAAEALRNHHFAFLHAPMLHPTMRAVMPIRRALGVRTLFNIIGPLTNPAGASRQVMGVYAPHLVPLVAEAMAMLGTQRAMVVHGDLQSRHTAASHPSTGYLGLDELSISGPSHVAEVRGAEVILSTVTPEDAGLVRAPLETLLGGDAATNAAILISIFAGEPGPRRDVVVLNAAAVLVTSDLAPDLASGARLAERTIDSGEVTALVAALSANRQTEH
jgi:anthranilate phosphoribosyltransferase